jgi:hypothetical protein
MLAPSDLRIVDERYGDDADVRKLTEEVRRLWRLETAVIQEATRGMMGLEELATLCHLPIAYRDKDVGQNPPPVR